MASQLIPMSLIALSILFLNSATAVDQPVRALRHQVTGAVHLDQLFQRDVLAPRQGSCVRATDTVCPDGNGCCPSGSPCVYTTTAGTTFGLCDVSCGPGMPLCTTPITGCCPQMGMRCGSDGTCTGLASGPAPPTSPSPPSGPAPLSSAQLSVIAPTLEFRVPAQYSSASVSASASASSLSASQSSVAGSSSSPLSTTGSSSGLNSPTHTKSANEASSSGSKTAASSATGTGGASSAAKGGSGWFAALLAFLML